MPETPQPSLAEKIQKEFEARVGPGIALEIVRDVFAGVLPQEGEPPDPVARIDLAAAKGKDYIGQLLQTGAYWENRVEAVGDRLKSEPGHEMELRLLEDLRGVVAEVVPTEIAEKAETGAEELTGGIRDYISERVLARSTDPQQRFPDRSQFQWEYNREARSVLKDLGVSEQSSLFKAGIADPDSMVKGSEEYIQAQRARQTVFDEILAARFLQGLPIEAEWINASRFREKKTFQRPPDMTDEVAGRYAAALAATIENLDQTVAWDPGQYQEQKSKQGSASSGVNDPITAVHEHYMSRLFDGMAHRDKLPVGIQMAEVADSSDPASVASFARGKALQIIIEGGDIETYIATLSAIPTERGYLGGVARQVWESLPADSSLRQGLGKILLTEHALELKGDDQVDFRNKVVEAMGSMPEVIAMRKATAEQVVSGAKNQIEATMTGRDIVRITSQSPAAEKFIDAMKAPKSNAEAERRQAAEALARQVIFGQVISDMTVKYLQSVADQFIAGQVPLSEVAIQTTRIQEALNHLDLMQASEVGDRSGNTMIKLTLKPEVYYGRNGAPEGQYEVPQAFRPLVAQASLARELLTMKYSGDEWRYPQTVGAYFRQAGEFGVEKSDFIKSYNQTVLSLVAASKMVDGKFGVDPYREMHAAWFTDVLPKLGSAVTGAQAEPTINNPGFSTFDYNGRFEIKGYSTYRSVGEKSAWGGDYQQQERNRLIEPRVFGGLEPVFETGVKIARARRLLRDESLLNRPNALAKVVDGLGSFRGSGADQEFQRGTDVRRNEEIAGTIAAGMTALQNDFHELDQLGQQEDSFNLAISKWEAGDRASVTGLGAVMYRAGKGDAARNRQAIEKEMEAFSGVKCEIEDPQKRQQALGAVRTAAERKQAEKARAIAEQISEMMKPVNNISARVGAFLRERTTPSFDPASPDQAVDKLRVPVVSGEGKDQRVQDKTIDLAEEDLGLDGYTPARILVPLMQLFSARDKAIAGPLRKGLDQLQRQNPLSVSTEALSEAILDARIKLGNDREPLSELAETLRTLVAKAIGTKLDQLDIAALTPQNLGNITGRMQTAFQREIISLQSDLGRREQRTSTA